MSAAGTVVIFGTLTLAASAAAVFAIQTKLSAKQSSQSVRESRVDRRETLRVFFGFVVAIAASITWAGGNVLSRYSANAYSGNIGAAVDISLANYASGTAFIALAATVLHFLPGDHGRFPKRNRTDRNPALYIAAFFKAANTYLFVAAVMFVSAAVAATLENLHVLWTATIVSLMGRSALNRIWWLSAFLLTIGSALILQLWIQASASLNVIGVSCAILAGIFFAFFVITWNEQIEEDATFAETTVRTAKFLGTTTVVLYLGSICWSIVTANYDLIPFSHISPRHLLLQLVNGVFNIGITYFLMAEALQLMKPAQRLASFLLALGISYAVLFTLLIESLVYGESVEFVQWIGVFLFSVGFAVIKANLARAQTGTNRG